MSAPYQSRCHAPPAPDTDTHPLIVLDWQQLLGSFWEGRQCFSNGLTTECRALNNTISPVWTSQRLLGHSKTAGYAS